jgi:alpha/beta superfamily hydrolase
MKISPNTKPMFWGAVMGAAACAVLGFTWGGWVTGATARKDAGAAAHTATVAALAPFCAERFRAQGDAPARIAELAKASTWERSNVVEKSGFATMPGTKNNDSDLARACVELLMAPAAPKA